MKGRRSRSLPFSPSAHGILGNVISGAFCENYISQHYRQKGRGGERATFKCNHYHRRGERLAQSQSDTTSLKRLCSFKSRFRNPKGKNFSKVFLTFAYNCQPVWKSLTNFTHPFFNQMEPGFNSQMVKSYHNSCPVPIPLKIYPHMELGDWLPVGCLF